jgi:gliding motility-associated-like protein
MGSSIIKDVITNLGGISGSVIYTVTPTIAAHLVLTDGSVSSSMVSTSGDSKTFTVFVRTLSVAPIAVLVSGNGIIKYKEDAVFTPSSSLESAKYTWYEGANKTNLITKGVDNGILSKHNLLPGIYTYYVAVSNPEFCEGELFPVSITINAIPIGQPPNVFTPNGDGIADAWLIENIEQYPHSDVRVFNKWGGTVYSSVGYSDPWMGDFNGKPLPVGVYYYSIDLKDENSMLYYGFVTIIR